MKLVFVLNQDGSPLMPCKPAKARKLLRDGKAKVARRKPFTIRLNWQCEGSTQPVKLGIDKGSHQTGFCAVANGRVLITGKISHRKDIKEKMDARREHRRSRRSRKWYRPARFGYRTHEYRKALGLEKDHHIDALCVVTLGDGEVIEPDLDNFYEVRFLPRQTRKQYHSCPQQGKGRVRYQVNEELGGFRKGDLVLVRGKWEKRVWSIYSTGSVAFPRVKGEPTSSVPKHCRLLERAKTVMFEIAR